MRGRRAGREGRGGRARRKGPRGKDGCTQGGPRGAGARPAASGEGAGGGLGGRGAGRGGAVSARRRAECSGRRPGHVRTRGRGPRRPRPGARRRPPEPGSPRGCGYGASGAGGRGGGRRETWCRRDRPGPGGGRWGPRGRGQKSSSARTREEAGPASVWGSSGAVGAGWAPPLGAGLQLCREGYGAAAPHHPGPGGLGTRRERRSVQPRPAAARGGGSAPLSSRPRFCDTLRLGLWSSQCMTELGPGRTFCTHWAQRPPGACSGTSICLGVERAPEWPMWHRVGPEPAVDLWGWGRWSLRMDSWDQQIP